MRFLIDGHNLIPRVGLRLDAPDDESELIGLLQDFSRNSRAAVEVYFDGAPDGYSGMRRMGLVTAHFINRRSDADSAIKARLKQLGRAARNWTVVTSDREVLRAAKSAQAVTETSQRFAARIKPLDGSTAPSESASAEPAEGKMSEHEIQSWLDLFERGP
jgi:predicted RNA-binding protein with PIN domain